MFTFSLVKGTLSLQFSRDMGEEREETLFLNISFSGKGESTEWGLFPLSPSHEISSVTKTVFWKDAQKFLERIQDVGDLPHIFKLRDFYADRESSFFRGRAKLASVSSAKGTSGQGTSIVEVDILGEQFGEIGETDALSLSFQPEILHPGSPLVLLSPIYYHISGNLLTFDWRRLPETLEQEKFLRSLSRHVELGLKRLLTASAS